MIKINNHLVLLKIQYNMGTHPFNDKQIAILEVVEKLFAEKGFDGTSVRDIAKAANINVAMISYYFGSKEKLLEGIVLYRSADLNIQMENIRNSEISPFEKLDSLVEFYVRLIHNNKSIYQIINVEFSNQKRKIDFELINQAKEGNYIELNRVIREGQEQGLFKEDVNTYLVAPTILGTYFHFYNSRSFYEKLIGIKDENQWESYIKNELTQHIKQVIKSLVKK